MAKKKGGSGITVMTESEINKKYAGLSTNAADAEEEAGNMLRIPTRCIWLNYQTGGGFVYGRVHEVFGYESSGKTLLAKEVGIATQKLGGVVIWGDAENAFDLAWAKKVGLDLTRMFIYNRNDIEGFSDWARDMCVAQRSKLTNNEPITLVLDSIAALECIDNLNADSLDSKAQMGNRAKAIYRFYRERNNLFSKLGITVIMINQVRSKVGASMFEAATTQPGGEATRFYSSIRIAIVPSKMIKGHWNDASGEWVDSRLKENDVKVGKEVIVKIEKNKTAATESDVRTEVYFKPDKSGYVGFSKYAGLDKILLDTGILKKSGMSYVYRYKKADHVLTKKRDGIIPCLQSDDNARRVILQKLGVLTISKAAERLESIKTNLFPV